MFRQIVQSAINSGRLKFAHAQENDQLKSIGLGDKKLQNWPTLASSCNYENIGEKENSNSLSDDKSIVHELQSDNICEDDELSISSRGTRGQANLSQSEQQSVTPTVLKRQVRPVRLTSQTSIK